MIGVMSKPGIASLVHVFVERTWGAAVAATCEIMKYCAASMQGEEQL